MVCSWLALLSYHFGVLFSILAVTYLLCPNISRKNIAAAAFGGDARDYGLWRGSSAVLEGKVPHLADQRGNGGRVAMALFGNRRALGRCRAVRCAREVDASRALGNVCGVCQRGNGGRVAMALFGNRRALGLCRAVRCAREVDASRALAYVCGVCQRCTPPG